MSITTQCMTANIQIGVWVGQRLDRAASDQVTQDAGAVADAARVNKHLIPKDALKPIQTAANALRAHLYQHTLPWKDNGDRLLTRAMYMGFMEKFGQLQTDFHDAVHTFLTDTYPAAVEQASFRMGGLFDPTDYPSPDLLRHKFYVNLDIDSVSEANDFRVALDQQEVERLQNEIERKLQTRLTGAMQDVWSRLVDTLGHFAEKMSTDAIFRDSTVKNLEELVEILPGLNVTGDPLLEQVRQDISAKLTGISPKDLRKDTQLRSSVGRDAQEIMDRMKGFMGAFGGGA
jgi:uncharacterized small protein (DUF1192 family)